jgi:4,5-dihydroxyphthalate decarboxylase
MSLLTLSCAFGDYAHTQDLRAGKIRPEGIDLVMSELPIEAIAPRFAAFLEFDVAEFSFGAYCAHIGSASEPKMIALPVFTSRSFRHGNIYVNSNAGIATAKDLAGRRIGIPQWVQTAVVYVRGFLADDAGVGLRDVTWVQAGVDEPGRVDGGNFVIPDGVKIERRPDDTLGAMLAKGEIDAIISARPPLAFLNGDPRIRRLYADYRAEEEAYFRRSGVFPIMHVVAIRRDLYERHRWVARNLFDAFTHAKDAAITKLSGTQVSYLPMAWAADTLEKTNSALFGRDAWPYGVKKNATTINQFLKYCHEQGVTRRKVGIEELFAPETELEIHV